MRDQRFVAHIDILGFSSIVQHDADAAWEVLSALVEVRDVASDLGLEFRGTNARFPIKDVIQSVTFSDTILLFTRGSSDTDLRSLIILVGEIFHKALCKAVPVRAGIAFGTFYFNITKSMYSGPALIDAYHVGESAQWLGIALSESVQERASALNMRSGKSSVVVPWALPLANGSRPCSVINWPAIFAHDFTCAAPLSVEQFYQTFESTFAPFHQLPAPVQVKYRNTVEFINEQLARHVGS